MDQAEAAVGGLDAALLGGLAPQLEPVLDVHAQAGGPDRVAEGLEAAVGVDGQVAVEGEGAGQHLLPGHAPLGEAQVLHEDQLGRREAVVDLGHGQLGAGVGDPGLGVGVGGGLGALREVGVVVGGVEVAGLGPGHEAEALHVQRLVGVAVGVLGPADDGGGGAVGHARAVEDRELAGDGGHGADLLGAGLPPELGPLVAGAVVVVLLGDLGHDHAQLVGVDAVALGVGGQVHGVHGRRGERPAGAVGGRVVARQALVAAVLHLLHTDGHGHVVGAGGHGVAGLAQGFGARGAEVLDQAHRLVDQLQRAGQVHAAGARHGGAQPVGVDVLGLDARRLVGRVRRLDEQVVGAGVPPLPEAGAAHPDDGDLVLDAVRAHVSPPCSGREGVVPSRSSCGSRPGCPGPGTSSRCGPRCGGHPRRNRSARRGSARHRRSRGWRR